MYAVNWTELAHDVTHINNSMVIKHNPRASKPYYSISNGQQINRGINEIEGKCPTEL